MLAGLSRVCHEGAGTKARSHEGTKTRSASGYRGVSNAALPSSTHPSCHQHRPARPSMQIARRMTRGMSS
jgi:hypothetical protein